MVIAFLLFCIISHICYSFFFRKYICEIQGKTFKEDSFDCEDDEEEILPDPNIDNLSIIAKEIGSSFMNHKASKIQEHVMADRVMKLS